MTTNILKKVIDSYLGYELESTKTKIMANEISNLAESLKLVGKQLIAISQILELTHDDVDPKNILPLIELLNQNNSDLSNDEKSSLDVESKNESVMISILKNKRKFNEFQVYCRLLVIENYVNLTYEELEKYLITHQSLVNNCDYSKLNDLIDFICDGHKKHHLSLLNKLKCPYHSTNNDKDEKSCNMTFTNGNCGISNCGKEFTFTFNENINWLNPLNDSRGFSFYIEETEPNTENLLGIFYKKD